MIIENCIREHDLKREEVLAAIEWLKDLGRIAEAGDGKWKLA